MPGSWVMREERQAELTPQIIQQRQDLRLDGDVKRRRRLVGDEERRAGHEGGRDHHALPLSTGEVVRILVQPRRRLADANSLQKVDRAAPCGGGRSFHAASAPQ